MPTKKSSRPKRKPTAKERTLLVFDPGPPIEPPPEIPWETKKKLTERYVLMDHPETGRAHLVFEYAAKHHPHPPAQTLCGATVRESWAKCGKGRARCQTCVYHGRKGLLV